MPIEAPRPGGCLDRAALFGLGLVLLLVLLPMMAAFGGSTARGFTSAAVLILAYAIVRGSLMLGAAAWRRAVAWTGAGCAGAAAVLALMMIWFPDTVDMAPGGMALAPRGCAAFGLVALLVADAGALGAVHLRRIPDRVVRGIALTTACLLCGPIVLACVAGSARPGWALALVSPVTWVWYLGLLGTGLVLHVATPILGRLETRREAVRRATAPDRALLTLQCPRCCAWMRMASGLVACPACRLPIRIEFEEPRCACGYALHQLHGECCPECGRVIPEEQRWGRGASQAARTQDAPGPAPDGAETGAPGITEVPLMPPPPPVS